MRPENLKTRIFVDSGDPAETRELIRLLGFLDGQTTNPTLISKNPNAKGKKFSEQEVLAFYKKVVQELSSLMPDGSISVEVYADASTSSATMLRQGREFFTWIPPHPWNKGAGAHIKFPTNHEGLKAAEQAVKEGMRVNMTLCFSQEQAAAVYAATRGAKKGQAPPQGSGAGQVFVSPFVGRLDDVGENGMGLIKNIIQMYREGDGHVEVLTASVRNMSHFMYALALGSDIITAPAGIIKEWGERGMPLPNAEFRYQNSELKPIPYKELDLNKPWAEFDIKHPLTDKGMQKFSDDWNALIKRHE